MTFRTSLFSVILQSWFLLFVECINIPVPAKTFYVPFPESQIDTNTFKVISSNTAGDTYKSIVALAISSDDTVIWYDHWEDGYDPISNSPAQGSTTEIWGDGDCSNGYAFGTVCDDVTNPDRLIAGQSIVISNTIDVNEAVTASTKRYDGRDKIVASHPIAMTRGMYPENIGSELAGAVEVADTAEWGTYFVAPVAEMMQNVDSTTGAFKHTAFYVMAKDPDTYLEYLSYDGTSISTVTLGAGESHSQSIENIGSRLYASKPVQVHLISGDTAADYELRWFSLLPRADWGKNYTSPTGDSTAENRIIMYNPNNYDISVSYDVIKSPDSPDSPDHGEIHTRSRVIGANNWKFTDIIHTGTGANLYSEDAFFAMSITDTVGDGSHFDWGFPLMPTYDLASQVLVGWGWGCTTVICNDGAGARSVVWVTPLEDADIYVDTDNDGVPESSMTITDALRLSSYKFEDDSDLDMTGAMIWAVQPGEVHTSPKTVKIAASWGQDACVSNIVDDNALDLGTLIKPTPVIQVNEVATLLDDADSSGGISDGDTVQYQINVQNVGRSDKEGVFIETDGVSDPSCTIEQNGIVVPCALARARRGLQKGKGATCDLAAGDECTLSYTAGSTTTGSTYDQQWTTDVSTSFDVTVLTPTYDFAELEQFFPDPICATCCGSQYTYDTGILAEADTIHKLPAGALEVLNIVDGVYVEFKVRQMWKGTANFEFNGGPDPVSHSHVIHQDYNQQCLEVCPKMEEVPAYAYVTPEGYPSGVFKACCDPETNTASVMVNMKDGQSQSCNESPSFACDGWPDGEGRSLYKFELTCSSSVGTPGPTPGPTPPSNTPDPTAAPTKPNLPATTPFPTPVASVANTPDPTPAPVTSTPNPTPADGGTLGPTPGGTDSASICAEERRRLVGRRGGRHLAFSLEEKWSIENFEFAYDWNHFEFDFELNTQIADLNQIRPQLLLDDCVTNYTGSALSINKLPFYGAGGLGRHNSPINVTVDPLIITSDPTYREDLSGSQVKAGIDFCLRYSLYTPPIAGDIEVNFLEIITRLDIDLTDGFALDEFNVAPKAICEEEAEDAFEIEAYFCETGNEADDTYVPLALNQGQLVKICVRPNAEARALGLRMRRIRNATFTMGDMTQRAIIDISRPAPNGLTEINCVPGYSICHFETLLMAPFFAAPGFVTCSGAADLQFGDQSNPLSVSPPGLVRRSLLRGEGDEEEDTFDGREIQALFYGRELQDEDDGASTESFFEVGANVNQGILYGTSGVAQPTMKSSWNHLIGCCLMGATSILVGLLM